LLCAEYGDAKCRKVWPVLIGGSGPMTCFDKGLQEATRILLFSGDLERVAKELESAFIQMECLGTVVSEK
jgi:hypothetical protein